MPVRSPSGNDMTQLVRDEVRGGLWGEEGGRSGLGAGLVGCIRAYFAAHTQPSCIRIVTVCMCVCQERDLDARILELTRSLQASAVAASAVAAFKGGGSEGGTSSKVASRSYEPAEVAAPLDSHAPARGTRISVARG